MPYATKEQKAEYDREYRARNAERLAAQRAKWRQENREHSQEYHRKRYLADREAYLARMAEYHKRMRMERAEEYSARKASNAAEWRRRNPEKYRAGYLLRYAVRSGKVERLPCQVCGAKAEAHHDDYSKPLDVLWLCRTHHFERHRAIRSASGSEPLASPAMRIAPRAR